MAEQPWTDQSPSASRPRDGEDQTPRSADELFEVDDFCRFLHVSRYQFDRMREVPGFPKPLLLPAVRQGKNERWRWGDIQAYLASLAE